MSRHEASAHRRWAAVWVALFLAAVLIAVLSMISSDPMAGAMVLSG